MDAGICSAERPVPASTSIGSHNVSRDYVKNGPARMKTRRVIFCIIPIMRNHYQKNAFFRSIFFGDIP